MKSLLVLFVIIIPSVSFADSFTINVSTNNVALINRFTPNTQAYLQSVINRSMDNLKEAIIRQRLSDPVEKQKIIDSIVNK